MYAFVGGMPEWMSFNYPMSQNTEWMNIEVETISPEDLLPLLRSGKYYILDVRPIDFEKDAPYLADSVYCPLIYLDRRHAGIPRDREIVITDWAMKQSPFAARYLIAQGYKVRGILKGGMERWKAENLPGVLTRKELR